MEECGMTELRSQGKLHTDDITFEVVQRTITSLLGRLGERHKEGACRRPTYIPLVHSVHICPTYNSSHQRLFAWELPLAAKALCGRLEVLVIAPPLSAALNQWLTGVGVQMSWLPLPSDRITLGNRFCITPQSIQMLWSSVCSLQELNFITCSLLSFPFPISILLSFCVSWDSYQTNNLHSNSCFKVCFGGNPTSDIWDIEVISDKWPLCTKVFWR